MVMDVISYAIALYRLNGCAEVQWQHAICNLYSFIYLENYYCVCIYKLPFVDGYVNSDGIISWCVFKFIDCEDI